eukprot:460480-Prorocentrum_minimum.AAC.1
MFCFRAAGLRPLLLPSPIALVRTKQQSSNSHTLSIRLFPGGDAGNTGNAGNGRDHALHLHNGTHSCCQGVGARQRVGSPQLPILGIRLSPSVTHTKVRLAFRRLGASLVLTALASPMRLAVRKFAYGSFAASLELAALAPPVRDAKRRPASGSLRASLQLARFTSSVTHAEMPLTSPVRLAEGQLAHSTFAAPLDLAAFAPSVRDTVGGAASRCVRASLKLATFTSPMRHTVRRAVLPRLGAPFVIAAPASPVRVTERALAPAVRLAVRYAAHCPFGASLLLTPLASPMSNAKGGAAPWRLVAFLALASLESTARFLGWRATLCRLRNNPLARLVHLELRTESGVAQGVCGGSTGVVFAALVAINARV